MTDATDRELSPFATALRQARLGKSLSVADFARQMRLSDTQVIGLEADDLVSFYGPDYARRAAQRCAESLGVDLALEGAPAEVLVSTSPVAEAPTPFVPYRATPGLSVKPVWIAAVLGLIVAGAVAAYLMRGKPVEPQSIAAVPAVTEPAAAPAPVSVPAPAPVESVEPAPTTVPTAVAPVVPPPPSTFLVSSFDTAAVPDDVDHRFFLVVTREVTIHATDTNGMVLISGSLQPDAGQRVVGNPPFKVAVSNEDAVEVYYKGKRVRTERNNNEGVSLSAGLAPQAR